MGLKNNIGERIMHLVNTFASGKNTAFAARIGTSEANIRNYINKGVLPKSDILGKIVLTFGISADWLLTGRGQISTPESIEDIQMLSMHSNELSVTDVSAKIIDKQLIPFYDIPSLCFIPGLVEPRIQPNKYLFLPDLPKCDGAMRMPGDQMAPEIKRSDIIIYRTVTNPDKFMFFGQICLMTIEQGDQRTMTARYVFDSEQKGYVKLVCGNERYPDQDIPLGAIRSLAEIKASIRYSTIV